MAEAEGAGLYSPWKHGKFIYFLANISSADQIELGLGVSPFMSLTNSCILPLEIVF